MSLRNFILGLSASFGIAWLVVVILPFVKMRNLQPIELSKELDGAEGVFYPKRDGRIANGAKVYAENGCYLCHTQLARPTYAGNDMYRADLAGLAKDNERGDTRRETNAYDFQGESFAQIGTTRIGPDLSNLARRMEVAAAKANAKQPSSNISAALLLYDHLYDPRREPEGRAATCPSHRFLFEEHEIKGQASDAALPFGGTDTTELVPSPDAKALVSYLLSLKKDQPAPKALDFTPPLAAKPAAK